MASISITNTFSNGTTADAGEVNTNFTDVANATSDGTIDFSIGALTVAGTATLNGAVNLGNASGDDLTFTGSLSSSIPIKTTNTYNIGSASLGLAGIYFGTSDTDTTRVVSDDVAADRTYTLPDAGADATFVMDASGVIGGARAFSGAISFTSSVTLDSTSPALILADDDTSVGSGTVIGTWRVTSDDASNTSGIASEIRSVGASSSGATTSIEFHTSTSGTLTQGPTIYDESIAFGTYSNPTSAYIQVVGNTLWASGKHALLVNDVDTAVDANNEMIRLAYSADSTATNGTYITFRDADGEIGHITVAGGTTVAYNTSSDVRLKDDIVDISDGIDRLKKMKPRYFKWKKSGAKDEGFIAQELKDIVPTAVSDDGPEFPDNMMSVDYGRVTPVLAAAIKELVARVEDLEKKLAEK